MDGGVDATLRRDRWGHAVRTASDSCIAAVDAYYEQVLTHGRYRAVILRAACDDPSCVLANTLAAHFLAAKDPAEACRLLRDASVSLDNATPYERAVFGAVSCLMADDKDEELVVNRLFELLKEFPKDLLSLKRAQILCFYMGRPDLSLNLVQEVLRHNEGQSYIYGMLSFPLLELGRMAEAEGAARKGLAIDSSDLWSQHNLCHVLQYKCRFKEAVDFMEACSSSWNSCSSFMYTHNWWHVAVCYLEGDCPLSKVLEVYDHYIWNELQRSDAEPAEVYINALGLLLRIYVRGHKDDIADRLMFIANLFKDKSTWHVEWLLDLLALWALASTEEASKAADLLESIKSSLQNPFLNMEGATFIEFLTCLVLILMPLTLKLLEHLMNSLMSLMKFGMLFYWILDKLPKQLKRLQSKLVKGKEPLSCGNCWKRRIPWKGDQMLISRVKRQRLYKLPTSNKLLTNLLGLYQCSTNCLR